MSGHGGRSFSLAINVQSVLLSFTRELTAMPLKVPH